MIVHGDYFPTGTQKFESLADCSLPPEYCQYTSKFEKCKPWLRDNYPELYPQLVAPRAAAPALPASDVAGVGGAASTAGAEAALPAAMSALSVASSAGMGTRVHLRPFLTMDGCCCCL